MRAINVTDEQREQAATLAGFGLSDKQIGLVVGMSEATLRRRLREELDVGRARAGAEVTRSLYQQAIGGSVIAAIYWTKCRLGWREVAAVEVSGPNGAPLPVLPSVLIVPAPVDETAWEAVVAAQQAKLVGGERMELADMRAQQRAERDARRAALSPAEREALPVVGQPSAMPVTPRPQYGSFDFDGNPVE